jgi:hypothetical protein
VLASRPSHPIPDLIGGREQTTSTLAMSAFGFHVVPSGLCDRRSEA